MEHLVALYPDIDRHPFSHTKMPVRMALIIQQQSVTCLLLSLEKDFVSYHRIRPGCNEFIYVYRNSENFVYLFLYLYMGYRFKQDYLLKTPYLFAISLYLWACVFIFLPIVDSTDWMLHIHAKCTLADPKFNQTWLLQFNHYCQWILARIKR